MSRQLRCRLTSLSRKAGDNPDTVPRSVGAGGVAPAPTPAPTVPGTVSWAQGRADRGAIGGVRERSLTRISRLYPNATGERA